MHGNAVNNKAAEDTTGTESENFWINRLLARSLVNVKVQLVLKPADQNPGECASTAAAFSCSWVTRGGCASSCVEEEVDLPTLSTGMFSLAGTRGLAPSPIVQ